MIFLRFYTSKSDLNPVQLHNLYYMPSKKLDKILFNKRVLPKKSDK